MSNTRTTILVMSHTMSHGGESTEESLEVSQMVQKAKEMDALRQFASCIRKGRRENKKK